jgi:hypothetical protein
VAPSCLMSPGITLPGPSSLNPYVARCYSRAADHSAAFALSGGAGTICRQVLHSDLRGIGGYSVGSKTSHARVCVPGACARVYT